MVEWSPGKLPCGCATGCPENYQAYMYLLPRTPTHKELFDLAEDMQCMLSPPAFACMVHGSHFHYF